MKNFNTTDIFFAAYLINKGYPVVNYETVIRTRKKYFFNIPDGDYKNLKIEFMNSRENEIKQKIEMLKNL